MTRTRLCSVAVGAVAALVVSLVPLAPAAAAAPRQEGTRHTAPLPIDPGASAAPAARARRAATAGHRVPNELLKEQLASEGEAGPGDDAPISALCQSFLPNKNPYAKTAPNVDQIVRDGVTQAGSATGCPTAQNETTIVTNPYNPRNLVAAANDYRDFNTRTGRNDSSGWAYSSSDGGRSWSNSRAPGLTLQSGARAPLSYMDSAGDPALAFGPNNIVYYANLVFSRTVPTDKSQQASGITVSVSRDGGRTWGEPSLIQLDGVKRDGSPTPTLVFNDKEWIAADPTSGTVYVTWTRFSFDAAGNYLESPIVVSKSTNFGRSWTAPNRISPSLDGFKGGITPFDQGSSPQVGRDGSLYVAYEASVCATAACSGMDDHDAVVVATSRDGGRTFRNKEVSLDFDIPATLTGENFRINSFPMTAYDGLTDRLWVTWSDDRNGQYSADGASTKTNADVFVVDARAGRDWSPVRKVGTSADEFFPAIAVVANRVAVSFYTRTYDPKGIGLDYAYAVAWDGGIDGARVRRITTQTEDPRVQFVTVDPDGTVIQGVFIGDYSGIAMGLDFNIHPCWTDFRGNPGVNTPNQDAYTQSIFAL